MINAQKIWERMDNIESTLTDVQISCSRFDEHEKSQNGQIADIRTFMMEMREEQKQLIDKITDVYTDTKEIKQKLDFNGERIQGLENQFSVHCAENKDRFQGLIQDIADYRQKREKLESDVKETTDTQIKEQREKIEHQGDQIKRQKEDILETIQQTLASREENLASKVIWKMVLGTGSLLGIVGAIAGLILLFTR